MIRTKKILALFLAVVLMFSALPFSVSADEIESMMETDGPVLYAQDPFNTVKSEVEGGTSYMTSVGVTRESIVRELEAHEHDSYYLGTKYVGGDAQSPNGDTSYNDGTVGMNCGGFVSYVLRKAGLDADLVMEIMQEIPGTTNWFGSGKPYDILAGASNYLNLIKNYNISAYAFRTKQELLSSGLAEKGDIILMWWSDNPGADGADNHIGFFWGEASDDDVMWHSGTEPSSGNQISAITPKTPGSFYILIKIEPLQPKEYEVTLTKTSADVSITQGNSAYSLAGATYNVYKGTCGTGSVVATFTTDAAGHATLSTPLEDGTYSVKEATPPKGYKLDTKVYTFTIDGSDTSLSVEDEPGTLTLRLQKKDSQTGSTPQGNASLAGAVYQVSYQKGGQTVTEELTSDASGNLGTLEGLPLGTVTVKELTAPEGYRLDTQVHTPLEDGTYSVKEATPPKGYKLDTKVYTFTIDGSDTSLSVEDEPGTLTLRLQKKDSQTGSTPQGNASLAGAVYQVSYQKGGQTVTEELTSDASGNLGTLEGLPLGTVTVKELTAPEGYRLDTQVHTYTVDGSQLTGDVYELEVTDLAEEVQRGALTIQKKDSQTGTTPQGDASLEGITFEIVNESQNPVVVNGSTAAPGQVAMTITTNASGVATTGENALPYGDYTLREKSTNESMLKTFTEEISVTISEDGQLLTYEAENDVVRGGIDLEKQDSQMGTTPQGNSSFANIDFEIINRSANPVVVDGQTYAVGDVVMIITTDEKGHASTGNDALPYGTYEVRESATNESMLLTWTGEIVQVRQNGHSVAITAVNDVERGGLSVEKQDTITGSTPQGDANFQGITFEIINNSRNPVMVEGQKYQPGEVVKTLVTDSEGKASTADDLLPYGEYILHESATNESMLLTAPDQTVLVEDDGIIYEFVMADEVVRGGVLIEKRDLESGLLTPLGGASLDGTLFEITNKSINAVYVNGALYQPGEVCATIEVVDGIAQTDARALPYGTYQMVESKPGEGYLHTDQIVRSFQIRKDGEIIEYRDGDAAYNQVIRGDLQFVKVGEGGESNMHRFANVAFKLTSQTTGETHMVVTDENGEVRTTTEWNPHSQNTNGNDGVEDESAWDDHNGTWFGLTTEGWMVDTQDELCALPYDTYTLEELPCAGNAGYELVKVPNITISRNNTTIYLGTIDDQFEGVPEIGTTATVDGEHTAEPTGEVTIVDTVTYKNLKVGQTYKLSGVLMDKATGEPLLVGEQQITAELEFTPDSPDGTVELTYTFDASALAGTSVVVFEDLYQGENVVASHADLEDEGQTVTFGQPEIGTTATINGEKTAQPAEQITITDTVEYSGLTIGQEYTLKGILMDKETGEPLLIGEEQVTSEATFTPAEANGTIDVLFTFDATGLEGKALVVFEKLFQGETEIASHVDLEDEGQTVNFVESPEIGTTATVDGQHTADPIGEITIVDAVEYSGLNPGQTYTVSGILMDKGTGEALLVDGAEVTAETEFTPEAASGTVELTYTLDASALAGTTIVVFETLYSDGVEIAIHADINDEDQTIIIAPKGGLLIQKTSEDGVLEGFTFLVESENYSETFTTDGAGKIYIQDLVPGEYTVTEQESDLTARYEIPAGQTITVTADEATTVEFYNQLLRGKITGHKTGAEQAPLEGVTFGLFDSETTEFTEETALATSITDESGEFTFEAPYGDYQVAELETVPGYVTMKESIAVEVNKTDVDLEDIANSQTVVHFSKVDKETGEELPGAVLELYSPDGSLLDTWETTDIPHVIPGLPVGEGYVLREVSAPDGYEVSEDITFEVTDITEIQTITMEDEPTPEEPDEPEKPEEPEEATPEIPQTGESPAVFWIGGLLILALLGLCVTIPLLRHCNKQ